jgi:hemerythrin-like domain-containing protein
MLVQLGKRTSSEDVVDLLHECHGRIRRFLVLARRLAVSSDAPSAEIAATAGQIRRYFAESFPLHTADEEIDIVPRIRGNGRAFDGLARIHADHHWHASAIAELIVLCSVLERDPGQAAEISQQLHAVAAQLAADLESHMEFEERTMFPALRQLPGHEQAAILAAMRRRRSRGRGIE